METSPNTSSAQEPISETFHASGAYEIINRVSAHYWEYPIYLRRSGGEWIEAGSPEEITEIIDNLKALAVEISQTGTEQ